MAISFIFPVFQNQHELFYLNTCSPPGKGAPHNSVERESTCFTNSSPRCCSTRLVEASAAATPTSWSGAALVVKGCLRPVPGGELDARSLSLSLSFSPLRYRATLVARRAILPTQHLQPREGNLVKHRLKNKRSVQCDVHRRKSPLRCDALLL